MSTIWFRDLGFHNNPFSIKPAAFHDQVLGYDKVIDELSYGILNNKVVILEGDYGNGKSTILRRILNDFGGKKQVIYYSCNRMEARLNVKKLLNGRYGFLGKMFDMKPKDMILLLDEAQELGAKDFQKLYSYYQEGYLKSIILVGKGIKKTEMAPELKPNVKEVSLVELDEEIAVKLVRKRIGDLSLLSDAIIKKIFARSNNNVRKLLKNCEEACRYATLTGRKQVGEDVVAHIFGEKVITKPAPKKKAVKKEEKETKKPAKKTSVKKVEKKEEKPKAKEEKKKKSVKVPAAPAAKKKKETVYNPDRYKDMMHSSAEELLNTPTDEMF